MPKIDSQIRIFNLVGNKQYSYHKQECNKPCSFWCFCVAWLALSCKRTIYRVNTWRSYFFISSEVNSARQSHFLLSLKKNCNRSKANSAKYKLYCFSYGEVKSGFEQKEYYIVCTFAFESHVNKFKVQQKESCGSSRRKWNSEVAVNFILQERIYVEIDLVDFTTLNWRSYFVKPKPSFTSTFVSNLCEF